VRLALEVAFQGPGGWPVRWLAEDGRAAPLQAGQAKPDAAGTLRLEVPGDTAAVLFKVVAGTEEVAYDFELHDVPLRGRPPKRLEPLRFPGHDAPVALEVVHVLRPPRGSASPAGPNVAVVELHVRNDSQKDVERLAMKFTYLDSSGRTLKEAPRHAVFLNDAGGLPEVLAGPAADGVSRLEKRVTPRSQVTIRVNDPDLPAGTERVLVTATAVEFADATTWSP
jgi:hypothetical protein